MKCCAVEITERMEHFIALRTGSAEFVTQKKEKRKNKQTDFFKRRTFGPDDGTIILDFP